MAIILPYFAEFGSFRGQLRKSGWLAINRISPEKRHNVHLLSTNGRAVLFAVAGLFIYISFRGMFKHLQYPSPTIRLGQSVSMCLRRSSTIAQLTMCWRRSRFTEALYDAASQATPWQDGVKLATGTSSDRDRSLDGPVARRSSMHAWAGI